MKAWVSAIWGIGGGMAIGGIISGVAFISGASFMSIREEEKREELVKKHAESKKVAVDAALDALGHDPQSMGKALAEQRDQIDREYKLKFDTLFDEAERTRKSAIEACLEIFHGLMTADTTEERIAAYKEVLELAKTEAAWVPIAEAVPNSFEVRTFAKP